MDYKLVFFLGLIIFLFSFCNQPVAKYEFQGIVEIPHPSRSAGQSALFADQNGTLYSSWIEYLNDSLSELQYAKLIEGGWSRSHTIGRGVDWFINWADFPSLVANENHLAAHWLEYSGEGTYDYDVMISQSSDGIDWSDPWVPHSDGIAAEHGFVSLLPMPDHHFFAAWLDGRNTKGEEHTVANHSHDHGHQGAMTLRAAYFDQAGDLDAEVELDAKVCDCCQTSAALTSNGPVVAYRNRTDDEIRDIYLVRQVAGEWLPGKPIFEDGWQIGGCPVNGPAVIARENQVAVGWYTMAGDIARVKFAHSADAGATFSDPLIISEVDPLGRIDVVFLNEEQVLVSWVERVSDDVAYLMGSVVTSDQKVAESFKIVETSTARKSGFPRLAVSDEKVYVSWTKIAGDDTRVNTAELIFH